MYIVRWLMTHPVVAIWVLGAIAILLSQNAVNKGAHEGENIEVTHQIEVSTDSANHKATSTLEAQTEKQLLVENEEPEINSAVSESTKSSTINQISDTSVKDTATTIVAVIVATDDTIEQIKDDDNIVQKVREVQPATLAPAQDQASNKQNSGNRDDSNLAQAASASELLIMAREAYWNNGFDEAAELYIQLIQLEPNKLDYKGELGNVYWRQGYPKKAAELYSEIALPMIENGNPDRVANMIGFIGLFYPDRAIKIHQKLISTIYGSK